MTTYVDASEVPEIELLKFARKFIETGEQPQIVFATKEAAVEFSKRLVDTVELMKTQH